MREPIQPVTLPSPWADIRIAVVIPTYNEVENLATLVSRLRSLRLPSLRIIVVDDNSPDGTGGEADAIAGGLNNDSPGSMVVIHRTAKQGIGRAHIEGMRCALDLGDSYVVQMDADLSHQPEAIPQLIATALATDADLTIGSRYVASGSLSPRWNFYRRLLSRGGSKYAQILLQTKISDMTGGFKVWRSAALSRLALDDIVFPAFSFQIEMNYRATRMGLRIVESPIHFDDRNAGSSKFSLRIQMEGMLAPFVLRWKLRRIR